MIEWQGGINCCCLNNLWPGMILLNRDQCQDD